MAATEEAAPGTAEWWEGRYQAGKTPWDTGVVPPEVRRLMAETARSGAPGGATGSGWALDIGCGSGTSSRFLAGHGLRVVGVDFSISALARARRGAVNEHLAAYFCAGDAADLGFLAVRAVLALDIGCLHGLPPERRACYVDSLAAHLLPGALYLLYAFAPEPADLPEELPPGAPSARLAAGSGPAGVGPQDIGGFAPQFRLLRTEYGTDRGRTSAWYLFERV